MGAYDDLAVVVNFTAFPARLSSTWRGQRSPRAAPRAAPASSRRAAREVLSRAHLGDQPATFDQLDRVESI